MHCLHGLNEANMAHALIVFLAGAAFGAMSAALYAFLCTKWGR